MIKSAIAITIATAVFLIAYLNTSNDSTFADPPTKKLDFPSTPLSNSLDEKSEPSQKQRDNQLRAIQSMIEGDGNPATSEVPADLQAIIQSQGSILDGSSLDPKNELPSIGPTNADPDQIVRTAESLLRGARLLQQITPAEKSRQILVKDMRKEAARLLLMAFPVDD